VEANVLVTRPLAPAGEEKEAIASLEDLKDARPLFSDSTCSGVSKTSYGFLVLGRLGQQVPQHDVQGP
jgi:hypothetical protein